MANENKPFGLKPVRHRFGGDLTRTYHRYKKEASVILGKGDAVVLTGSSEAGTGVPLITRAAAGSGTITGVVVGFDPQLADLSKNYMAAADTGYVTVCDDPNVIFHIQEDSVGSNVAVTDVGEFADLATISNASTTTGSSMMLDSSDAGTGDQLRILGLAQIAGNEIGSYAVWEVAINEHTFKAVETPV